MFFKKFSRYFLLFLSCRIYSISRFLGRKNEKKKKGESQLLYIQASISRFLGRMISITSFHNNNTLVLNRQTSSHNKNDTHAARLLINKASRLNKRRRGRKKEKQQINGKYDFSPSFFYYITSYHRSQSLFHPSKK